MPYHHQRDAQLRHCVFDAARGGQVNGIDGVADDEKLAQAQPEEDFRWGTRESEQPTSTVKGG